MYSSGSTAGLNRGTFSFESICISSPGSYLLALRFDCTSGTARYHLAEFSVCGVYARLLRKHAEEHEDCRDLALDKHRHQSIDRVLDRKKVRFSVVALKKRPAGDHFFQHRELEEIPNDVLIRVDAEG